MDMISIRRKLMARVESGGIDTSPRIAEYGVYWNRTFGSKTADANWCVTEWYEIANAPLGSININGYIGADTFGITFQYYRADGKTDWYYFAGVNPRSIPLHNTSITSISFSIELQVISNSYAYVVETGQILFAGRNTPYYGYTNINDMPTGT